MVFAGVGGLMRAGFGGGVCSRFGLVGVSGVWTGPVRGFGCLGACSGWVRRLGAPVGGWLDGLEVLVDAGDEGCGGPGLWDAYDDSAGVVYELGGGVP